MSFFVVWLDLTIYNLLLKDDIGDKSIFMFNALPQDEKNALIEKLSKQK